MTGWQRFRAGHAVVSYGQPVYGKPRIVANAPLTLIDFDHLIEALAEARDAYREAIEKLQLPDD